MQEEIRKTTAEASLAEIELVVAQEKERDRLARPGLNRVLNIFDVIAGQAVEGYIEILEHWERRLGDDPDLPIQININSPGGSVMDGLALYDVIQRLRRKGFKIVTRGTGLVASMAVIILQAGDERIADENVQILVHELSSRVGGKVSGIQDEAAMMDRLNDRLLGILAEKSTLSKRQISTKANRREWWLDSSEALKSGLVDRVE